jgi:hypothetical protein
VCDIGRCSHSRQDKNATQRICLVVHASLTFLGFDVFIQPCLIVAATTVRNPTCHLYSVGNPESDLKSSFKQGDMMSSRRLFEVSHRLFLSATRCTQRQIPSPQILLTCARKTCGITPFVCHSQKLLPTTRPHTTSLRQAACFHLHDLLATFSKGDIPVIYSITAC